MFEHSFYYPEKRKTFEEITEFINETSKPIVFTYGYEYRHPTIHRVPICKDDVLFKIENNGLIDIIEEEEVIHVNQFSDNDMW